MFVPSTLHLSFNSKQLLCILLSFNLPLSSYSKQLLCILVPSTLLISSYSKQLLYVFVSQLFFSLLLILNNFSASPFHNSSSLYLVLTRSNCSVSLFPQLFISLLTLSNSKQLLCILLSFNLPLSSYSKQLL